MKLIYVAHIYELRNGKCCINIPTADLHITLRDKDLARHKITGSLLAHVADHKMETGFYPKSDPQKFNSAAAKPEDHIDLNAPSDKTILRMSCDVYSLSDKNIDLYISNQILKEANGCDGQCSDCSSCVPLV